MNLSDRSDDDLLSDIAALVESHRELTARLVAHLAEIEERRLHLLAGYSSMFDFCRQKLGMSEGEAFRRILAARLARRFPVVYSLLAAGSVNLSTLELVREWLTDENHAELLGAVATKSKREVQGILAARFPRPDRPSRIRRQSSVEPLSEGRWRIEFTASDELREKIERCRDLMSHANPSGELGVVVERAVDLLLVHLEKNRLARTVKTKRVRSNSARESSENAGESSRTPKAARVTNAVRREVFERDGVRCTFVAEDGRRCDSRAHLELDHVVPKALGGSSDARNLRVRCRAHNQLWAEQAFGRERIEARRRFRQKKSEPLRGEGQGGAHESRTTVEKLHLALRGLGFREHEARRAIAEVVKMHAEPEALSLEQALREALRIATAA